MDKIQKIHLITCGLIEQICLQKIVSGKDLFQVETLHPGNFYKINLMLLFV